MFQVQGNVRVSEAEDRVEISQEDVNMVVSQTGVKEDVAIKALEKAKGDIAEAILSLKS
jgi:nascent polypeptide-associated complex subunit alpha